jgi:hypothetical protein
MAYWKIEESAGPYYFPWPDSYETAESAGKALNGWFVAQKAAGKQAPDRSRFRLTEYTVTRYGVERTSSVRVTVPSTDSQKEQES